MANFNISAGGGSAYDEWKMFFKLLHMRMGQTLLMLYFWNNMASKQKPRKKLSSEELFSKHAIETEQHITCQL
jgi:hypothetical protein